MSSDSILPPDFFGDEWRVNHDVIKCMQQLSWYTLWGIEIIEDKSRI
jgi:hypothetical protein